MNKKTRPDLKTVIDLVKVETEDGIIRDYLIARAKEFFSKSAFTRDKNAHLANVILSTMTAKASDKALALNESLGFLAIEFSGIARDLKK